MCVCMQFVCDDHKYPRMSCHFIVLAYTNDIVLAIQRSQMIICLLSADYLSDSNAVFVLESGVQVGLHLMRCGVNAVFTSH